MKLEVKVLGLKFLTVLGCMGLSLVSANVSAHVSAHVQAEEVPPEFQLRVETRPLQNDELAAELQKIDNLDLVAQTNEGFSEFVQIFETLWVIGEKLYPIIKASEPEINVRKQSWSVFPEGVRQANQLTSWKAPRASGEELVYTNAYGIEVVRLRYIVSYVYGGQYQDQGSYLTHISFLPSTIHALWGFKVDMQAESKEALNVGSAEQPVAGFSFDVHTTVRGVLGNLTVSQIERETRYFLDGEGQIKVLR